MTLDNSFKQPPSMKERHGSLLEYFSNPNRAMQGIMVTSNNISHCFNLIKQYAESMSEERQQGGTRQPEYEIDATLLMDLEDIKENIEKFKKNPGPTHDESVQYFEKLRNRLLDRFPTQ